MVCPPAGVSSTPLTLTVEALSPEGLYKVDDASRPNITLTIIPTPPNTLTLSGQTFLMQKGGCSPSQNITTSPTPNTNVNVEFDLTTLNNNNLYMYVMPSGSYSNVVTFTSVDTNTVQTITICSEENATVTSTILIPLTITGTDNSSYYMSSSRYSVNVSVTNQTRPPTITVNVPNLIDSGTVTLNISSPVNGDYMYSLREGSFPDDNTSYAFYQNMTANKNYTIQSSADFLQREYSSPRFYVIDTILGLAP